MPVTGAPNYGDDAAELGSFPHILIDEEGLGNEGRVGECRSIKTAWNLSLRLSRSPMIRMRSPRTAQQMQPLFISKTSSSALATSSLSMPKSLTIAAYRRPWVSLSIQLSSAALRAEIAG
jgi:hypothetical protein